jgi:hypothetical protein
LAPFGCDSAARHTIKQFVPNSRSSGAAAADLEERCQSEGVGRTRDVFALGNRDKDL